MLNERIARGQELVTNLHLIEDQKHNPVVDILVPGKLSFKVSNENQSRIIPEMLRGASNARVLAVDYMEREYPRFGNRSARYFLISYEENGQLKKAWLPIACVSVNKIAINFI